MTSHSLAHLNAFACCLLKPARLCARPVHLQLEPTTFCNLVCPQCPRASYVSTPRHLSLLQARQILDAVRPTHLTLSGLGEPTLNPDLYPMISLGKERHIRVNTTSNFVAVRQGDLDGLVQSGLDLLNVSVDAATPETYAKVRSRDAFVAVTRHIREFLEARRQQQRRYPALRMTFVIQRENLREMAAFYQLARDLAVEAVLYQVFSDSAMAEKKCVLEGVSIAEFEAQLAELKILEKRYGRPVTNVAYLDGQFDAIKSIYAGKPINLVRRCIKPWISLYITVEGDVRPCCSFGARGMSLGTVFDVRDISEIFRNRRYQEFRKQIRKGSAPDLICARCIPESALDIVKRTRWTPGFLRQ